MCSSRANFLSRLIALTVSIGALLSSPARADQPPVVSAAPSVTVNEGSTVCFDVTSTDPDGDPILSCTVSGGPPGSSFTPSPGGGMTFCWTPSFTAAGSYLVTFTCCNTLCGSVTTVITVFNVCHAAPVADAGGPYTGFVNTPVQFNGTGSFDPDGGSLTFLWDLGDGNMAIGPTPSHSYAAINLYAVTLTVTSVCGTATATTTADIGQACEARAFTRGGNRTIRLGSGRPVACIQIEPVAGCYGNTDVTLSSIVMQYSGGAVEEIHAIADKTVQIVDSDGNGIAEIPACFSKDDLRLLFSGLPAGQNSPTVSIRADLATGGHLQATITLRVFSSGGALSASVSPNPLNPAATLSFVTTQSGPLRVTLYDTSGRMVRRIMDVTAAAAGRHAITLDGLRENGAKLASGVYYFRVEAREGTSEGRFVILK